MPSTGVLQFPPFALDVGNEQLWHGEQLLPLRPKPFAILRYLVERPGRLVTKDELLKAIWPQTYVSEGLLHTYLRDLRHVLNDDPEAPRFIETVVRRGYRFIAPLTEEQTAAHPKDKATAAGVKQFTASALPVTISVQPTLVGREAALASLQERLAQALAGQRQLVFVTGEPGIGKTTVVDAFLEQVSTKQGVWIGRGQCVAQYGAGEAYLPILEALDRLCRETGGGQLVTLLRRHAPSWLVQLPGLLNDTELDELQRKVQRVTKERMLRELAEALAALTADQPLVLVLEDLHWSDASTLDLLTAVARRREAARLLVVGTYRPAEVIVSGHPLRAVTQELSLHGHCTEVPLTFLAASDILQYLAGRFPQSQFPIELGHVLHRHTEGNPLFLVTTVEDLVTRQVIGEREGQWQVQGALDAVVLGVPGSVQQLIVRHFERLTVQEQDVLELASVAGESFSTASVAAGLKAELEQVEGCCERLARREQFLQAQEVTTWPDGTVAGRYRFVHAFYQQAVYERIGAARRIQLHRRIGERLETGYGERTSEIAAELAVHFEWGHEYQRAVRYCEHAGKNATQRSAYREAIIHCSRGLELLKTLPDTLERVQQELALQIALVGPLTATKGYAAPEVEKIYTRARELCQQLGETPQLFQVLLGLFSFHIVRVECKTARELAEQCLTLAQSAQDQVLLIEAHRALGQCLYLLGELVSAREHLEQSIVLYGPQPRYADAFFWTDPGVVSYSWGALTLWQLGYPDQALQRAHEALTLAQKLLNTYTLATALGRTAMLHHFRQERDAMQTRAEETITLSTEQGFPFFSMQSAVLKGWTQAQQGQMEEGIAQMHQGVNALRDMGVESTRPYHLALLAEVYGKAGQEAKGLAALAEALSLVENSGERFYEAELYRLKGELLLAQESKRQPAKSDRQKSQNPHPQSQSPESYSEAEACFMKAIEIARSRSARSLELRAAMSLSRLWQQQRKRKKAHQMLSEIYNWFTEGFDTKDLQEAKTLLDDLQ